LRLLGVFQSFSKLLEDLTATGSGYRGETNACLLQHV